MRKILTASLMMLASQTWSADFEAYCEIYSFLWGPNSTNSKIILGWNEQNEPQIAKFFLVEISDERIILEGDISVVIKKSGDENRGKAFINGDPFNCSQIIINDTTMPPKRPVDDLESRLEQIETDLLLLKQMILENSD